jgi:hypothetical protein
MIMTITKTITQKVEIEVQFPYYSKDNICHWYKAISETKMIKIFSNTSGEYGSIDLTEYCIYSAFDERTTQITEKEFNDKFYEVTTNITNNL